MHFYKKTAGVFYMRLEGKKKMKGLVMIAKMKIQTLKVMNMDQKKDQNLQMITVGIQMWHLKNQMLKVLVFHHPNRVN